MIVPVLLVDHRPRRPTDLNSTASPLRLAIRPNAVPRRHPLRRPLATDPPTTSAQPRPRHRLGPKPSIAPVTDLTLPSARVTAVPAVGPNAGHPLPFATCLRPGIVARLRARRISTGRARSGLHRALQACAVRAHCRQTSGACGTRAQPEDRFASPSPPGGRRASGHFPLRSWAAYARARSARAAKPRVAVCNCNQTYAISIARCVWLSKPP